MGKYLGANIIQGRTTCTTFSNTLDSIKAKLSSWKARNLSLAGIITLANLIVQAILIYPMLTTKFPLLICKEINKTIHNFVWGSSKNNRKMHLVSWEEVCKPKCCGGLGLRKAEGANKILFMKLGWRFLSNPDALWIKLLKAKYVKTDSFLNSLQPRHGYSNILRGIFSV